MSEESTVVTLKKDGRVTIDTPTSRGVEELDNARQALYFLMGWTCVEAKPTIVREDEA